MILIREIITNNLLFLDIALAVVIIAHLMNQRRKLGWLKTMDRLGNQGAVAILTLTVGHIILRAWSAVLLLLYQYGVNIIELELQYGIGLFGNAVAVVGMILCLRVFSREAWGEKAWIIASIASAIGTFFMVVIL